MEKNGYEGSLDVKPFAFGSNRDVPLDLYQPKPMFTVLKGKTYLSQPQKTTAEVSKQDFLALFLLILTQSKSHEPISSLNNVI